MRRIALFMNVSLDGYFEGRDHDLSWATTEYEAFEPGAGPEPDAILLGHRTYDLMKLFWPTREAQQSQPEIARIMNETQKYVVSRVPFDPGWENVTVISSDVTEEIGRLKEAPGGAIMIFGSNELCVTLMQEGLIDEFQIMVNPIVLGEGTTLFEGLPEHTPLKLVSARTFDTDAVLLTYEPAGR